MPCSSWKQIKKMHTLNFFGLSNNLGKGKYNYKKYNYLFIDYLLFFNYIA